MKHRILSVALALVLCICLSINVFAGSDSDSGLTTGGTSKIYSSASLSVNKNYGIATTSADVTSGITLATTIIYYYINGSGQTQTSSDSGTTSASAGTTYYNQGTRATSQHSVKGGSKYGNWSCSLSASAY